MNRNMSAFVGRFALLLVLALAAGCGDGDGERADYTGVWQGRTSNGGSIVFTVEGDWVVSLRLVDPQGVIWMPQPTDVTGHSFSAEYATDTAATDDVSLQGTFDSATGATGRYAMRKGGNVLNGTFAAQRQ
ncbi:MAG: hypothetical protein AB7V22_02435 [Kiritimatiellia bacterium]